MLVLFAGLWVPEAPAQQRIIETVSEDIEKASSNETGEGCEEGQHNREVSSPVRAGRVAFEHVVENCGERAELAMQRTEIGGTYWYGWSMYVPEDFDEREHFTIVMQLAAWPSPRDGEFPCGGVGHKINIGSDGAVEYDLQYAGEEEDSVCDEHTLATDDKFREDELHCPP